MNSTQERGNSAAGVAFVPRELPEPAHSCHTLVNASYGRVFLLFFSRRMREHAYDLMLSHLAYPLLRQGDMSRIKLT